MKCDSFPASVWEAGARNPTTNFKKTGGCPRCEEASVAVTLAGSAGHRPVSRHLIHQDIFTRAKHYPHRDRSQALPSGGPIARPFVRARPEHVPLLGETIGE